jgi:hypothetical protein
MHNQGPVTAKWEHISNVYRLDQLNLVRSLCKLTEDHLKPAAQHAMKVSLAAQVMSHTVAATLNAVVSEVKEHCSAFIVL